MKGKLIAYKFTENDISNKEKDNHTNNDTQYITWKTEVISGEPVT